MAHLISKNKTLYYQQIKKNKSWGGVGQLNKTHALKNIKFIWRDLPKYEYDTNNDNSNSNDLALNKRYLFLHRNHTSKTSYIKNSDMFFNVVIYMFLHMQFRNLL